MSLKFNNTEITSTIFKDAAHPDGVTLCKLVYNGTLAWESHDYTPWQTTTQPTCTVAGVEERSCRRTGCGDSEHQQVAALGHLWQNPVYQWDGNVSVEATRICQRNTSHSEIATSYDVSSTVTAVATCTTDGKEVFTATFKESWANTPGVNRTETITALGHTSVVIAGQKATCTNTGLTVGSKCSVCNEILVAQELIPATGHNMAASWITQIPASCTSTGTKKRNCTACDYYETDTIPALGHSYIATVVNPTCTVQGYTKYTCGECDNSYKDNYTAATGHSWGSWQIIKNATCTEPGSKRRDCTECDNWEFGTIEATGHSYTPKVVAPTCGAQGYTHYTCGCGVGYKDNYTDATGLHSWGSWTTVIEPTCYAEGKRIRRCKECAATDDQIALPKPHTESDWAVTVQPTFTTTGTRAKSCTVCGFIIAEETIPKLEPLTYTLLSDGTYSVKATNTSVPGDITIPETYNGKRVTTIENNGFANCTSIGYVDAEFITTIGENAFKDSSITSFYAGASCTTLGKKAFYGCTSLDVAALDESGITKILENTFCDCSSLNEVYLPAGLTYIGEYAFEYCRSLYELWLPADLQYIGAYAFRGCSNLTEIDPSANTTYWYVFDDTLGGKYITVSAQEMARLATNDYVEYEWNKFYAPVVTASLTSTYNGVALNITNKNSFRLNLYLEGVFSGSSPGSDTETTPMSAGASANFTLTTGGSFSKCKIYAWFTQFTNCKTTLEIQGTETDVPEETTTG